MQGDRNSRQKAKIWFFSILWGFFSISWGHCVTSMHDKDSLITYLCTQGGLLLQVIHKLSVLFNPFADSGSSKVPTHDKIIQFFIFSLQLEENCPSDIKFFQ